MLPTSAVSLALWFVDQVLVSEVRMQVALVAVKKSGTADLFKSNGVVITEYTGMLHPGLIGAFVKARVRPNADMTHVHGGVDLHWLLARSKGTVGYSLPVVATVP